jgi:hypothetical protein
MSAFTLYEEGQYDKVLERARECSDEIWERESQYFEYYGETIVHKAAADGDKQCDLLLELLKLQPDTSKDTTNFGLLPIHLAGVGQSLRGAKMLYDVYPDGVKQRIVGGIHIGGTALHVTVFYADFNCQAKPDDILQLVHFLVEKYPEALLIRNTCGWTPLDTAILLHGGSLHEKAIELIKCLRDKTELLPRGDHVIREADAIAATTGEDEDGVIPRKIRIVMNHAGCSHKEAMWALKMREGDILGAVFEARTEDDFEGGRF